MPLASLTACPDLRPGGGLLPHQPGWLREQALEPWREHPGGLHHGRARNADKALTAIRESDGIVVNVSDQEIMAAQQLLGRTCGVFGEPPASLAPPAWKTLRQGVIGKDDTVVVWSRRPQGRGQRHQGRGRTHLHPSDGPPAGGLCGKGHHCGISGKGPAVSRRPFS